VVLVPAVVNDPAKLETRVVDNLLKVSIATISSYPFLERRLFCSTQAGVLTLLSVSKDDKFDWHFIVMNRKLVEGGYLGDIFVYNFKMCIIHHSLDIGSGITLCLIS